MKGYRMKTASWYSTLAYRMTIGSACLVMVAGCREQSSPGGDNGHDENHASHVIPAHKPKTFPDAVRRLREMNDQMFRGGVKEDPGSSLDEKTLQMALDIANWLPEIAADSDMPERPWNEVNARSGALVMDYQVIITGAADGARFKAVHGAGQAISDLEKLLAQADPRWFAGPENRGQAP
jgi:hypothetical protein